MWADNRQLASRSNNFGGQRILLALLVLYSHSYSLLARPNAPEPLLSLTKGHLTFGMLAVNMFLIISGFLVSQSWISSKNAWNFMVRRIRRVYPGFVVLSLLQAFVLAPLFCTQSNPWYTPRQLALIAFEIVDLVGYGFPYGGLLDVFANNPLPNAINGSLWTIRYEFVCYVVLAALASLGMFRRRWVTLVMVAAGIVLQFLQMRGVMFPWHRILTAVFGSAEHLPRIFTYFFAGVAFFLYRDRIPFSGTLAALSALGLAATLVVPVLHPALVAIFGTYAVLWAAFQRRVDLEPLARRADLSYGIYLYAFPVQQMLIALFLPRLNPWTLFATASVLTLICATFSWFVVEKPFLTRKPKAQPAETVLPLPRRLSA